MIKRMTDLEIIQFTCYRLKHEWRNKHGENR